MSEWSYRKAIRANPNDSLLRSAEEQRMIEILDLLSAKLYPREVNGYIYDYSPHELDIIVRDGEKYVRHRLTDVSIREWIDVSVVEIIAREIKNEFEKTRKDG